MALKFNIGKNIKAARKDAGLSQRELGERIGLSGTAQGVISHLETGRTVPGIKTIIDIAAALGLTVDGLLQYHLNPIDRAKSSAALTDNASKNRVPLIEWGSIASNRHYAHAKRWVPCPSGHSSKTYALLVDGDSMQSNSGRSYPSGSVIFCDPVVVHYSGAAVIALLNNEIPTFRLYREDSGEELLMPLNELYKPRLLSDADSVVATIIGSFIPETR